MTATPDWSTSLQPGGVSAFDVDGTLIGSIRSDVLRPGAVPQLIGGNAADTALVAIVEGIGSRASCGGDLA